MKKALNRAFSVAVLASAVGTSAIPAFSHETTDDENIPFAAPTPACISEASVSLESDDDLIAESDSDEAIISEVAEIDHHLASASENEAVVSREVDDSSSDGISKDKEQVESSNLDADETVNSTESSEKSSEDVGTKGDENSDKDDKKASEETDNKADSVAEGQASSQNEINDGAENPEKNKDAGEAPKEEAKAPINSCLFSGEVNSLADGTLSISGTASNGDPLVLDFIVDEDSELAVGVKQGDKVIVYYEETESGGYRVTSARYLNGEAPRNIFPNDLAIQKAEAERKQAELQNDDSDEESSEDVLKVVGIEVEGNSATTSEEILKVVSTRVGDPLLDPRIRRDMQAIYDSGYFTDVRLDTRFAPGGVRLVFRVLENPVVQGIKISGNKITDNDTLLGLMHTEPGKILNTRVLQADLQAINKYYNEDLNYVVAPSHITNMQMKDGILHLEIIDGITIEKVEVTGVTVFPKDMVDALVTSKPGDLYNRKTATSDADAIAALYEKEDYLLDNIRPSMDPKTGTMSIDVTEAELEEIKIVGTVRTKDETILRNLRTRPGEVMRRNKIQKDMERLNRLGLFKKVEPSLEPGSEPGKSIMTLNIEEQKTGLATIGVGYAGGGSGAVRPGITGAISYSERNLFGEAKSISVNLQQGAQIGSYSISYTDPAINDAQDSIGVSVYYNDVKELRQAVDGADAGTYALYDQRVYGATFTYGHPINDDLRLYATLRHDHINLKVSDDSIYEPTGMGEGDLNSLAFSALYDTRDDLFSPHHGAYGTGTITYAGGLLGGSYDYMKFVGEGRYYIPIGEKCTVALRGMYGIVGDHAPASERFYAGGTDTMRAYSDNFAYGSQMFVANAEFRFPLFGLKMLNGAVFADAGNAWSSWSTHKGKIFADAGVGLRIVFPTLGLGVIRLDYAHGSQGGRVSIGIGQSF